jgi:hypothetical protein
MLGPNNARKAWLAAAAALVGYLTGVLDPTAIGLAAFAGVTTVQWLGAVGTVLASFGLVYAVPNKPPDLGP